MLQIKRRRKRRIEMKNKFLRKLVWVNLAVAWKSLDGENLCEAINKIRAFVKGTNLHSSCFKYLEKTLKRGKKIGKEM